MNLLALELSSAAPGIALAAGTAVHERALAGERGRALLGEIDALLRAAGVARSALSGVVVGTGPGSYTGLRIACAAARALAYALAIPCGGLCSFQAAALAAPAGTLVHVLLDAYRGEVYHAAYRRLAGGVQVLTPPRILERTQARAAVPAEAWLIGDPALGEHRGPLLAPAVLPQASQVLELAAATPVADWGPATPLYLRAALKRPPPPPPGA